MLRRWAGQLEAAFHFSHRVAMRWRPVGLGDAGVKNAECLHNAQLYALGSDEDERTSAGANRRLMIMALMATDFPTGGAGDARGLGGEIGVTMRR